MLEVQLADRSVPLTNELNSVRTNTEGSASGTSTELPEPPNSLAKGMCRFKMVRDYPDGKNVLRIEAVPFFV